MEILRGKAVLEGTAKGKIWCIRKAEIEIPKVDEAEIESQIMIFETARLDAIRQLTTFYQNASREGWKSVADTYEVHILMLRDETFINYVIDIIRSEQAGAADAVRKTRDLFIASYTDKHDDYLLERTKDIRYICEQILKRIPTDDVKIPVAKGNSSKPDSKETRGRNPIVANMKFITKDTIVMADNLSPTEIMLLDKPLIVGIIVSAKTLNPHVIMAARTLKKPILAGVEYNESFHGLECLLDCTAGLAYVTPSVSASRQFDFSAHKFKQSAESYNIYRNSKSFEATEALFPVLGSINSLSDVNALLDDNITGIGLFRTEMYFLKRAEVPSEERQFIEYQKLLKLMGEKKVVIRTVDFGFDKWPKFLANKADANYTSGYRGLRVCLDNKELFRKQVRAIFRASMYGNVSLLLPTAFMLKEVIEAQNIINAVKKELRAEKIPYRDIEVGVMIDMAASAIMSDYLAQRVDFLCIGLDFLASSILSVDVMNERESAKLAYHHPAVLRLIQLTASNAHKNGCKVTLSVDNDLDANDIHIINSMGIDELTIPDSMVLKVRKYMKDEIETAREQ